MIARGLKNINYIIYSKIYFCAKPFGSHCGVQEIKHSIQSPTAPFSKFY